MRQLIALGPFTLVCSLVLPASAVVLQPDGTQMPLTPNNGEIPLQELFDFREGAAAIDALVDAASAPSTFRPSCEFSAQFLLAETGDRGRSVGWYNSPTTNTAPTLICDAATDMDEMGAPCDGDEIYIIMPGLQATDDPVFSSNGDPLNNPGQIFTANDILTHPHYAGGEIGLVLNTSQKHYSEPRLNPLCVANNMSCTDGEPWLPTVMYSSATFPNSYYMGVEDQDVGPATWGGNDGDFNDFVLFFTGLICAGAGDLCDTGEPGICAQGVTDCADLEGVSECRPIRTPEAETCNGLDDNCDGETDEGDLCSAREICDRGECRPLCSTGEFVCPSGTECTEAGVCVDVQCLDVACPAEQVCVEGTCQGACLGVVCPSGQTCTGGRCHDPCASVDCEADEVCQLGLCIPACDCVGCEPGLECNTSSGRCVEPGCGDVDCAAGQHCSVGSCVDDCAGVVCPGNAACEAGQCGEPLIGAGGEGGEGNDAGSAGRLGIGGSLSLGGSVGIGGTPSGPPGSGATGGSGPNTGSGGVFTAQRDEADTGGCTCHIERRSSVPGWASLSLLAALSLLRRRREKRCLRS